MANLEFDRIRRNADAQFLAYTLQFPSDSVEMDYHYRMKKDHTFHVCHYSLQIAQSLKIAEKEIILCYLIALFHDIARFPQLAQFRTFRDQLSFNHALHSSKILRNLGIINALEKSDQDAIYRAIEMHNLPVLPLSESPKTLMFSQILRDADKLDILHFFGDYYQTDRPFQTIIDQDLSKAQEISHEVLELYLAEKAIPISMVHTLLEFKALHLGWIFQLNFPKSREILKNERTIVKIWESIPASDLKNQLASKIQAYL